MWVVGCRLSHGCVASFFQWFIWVTIFNLICIITMLVYSNEQWSTKLTHPAPQQRVCSLVLCSAMDSGCCRFSAPCAMRKPQPLFFSFLFFFFFSVETISATSLYCTDSPDLWKDHLSSGEILSTADINTFNLRNSSNLLSELYHLL